VTGGLSLLPYKDPDQRRRYGREWIKRNPEKARQAMRRWRKRHPEQHNAERRDFYARHRDTELARLDAYRRANPHVPRAAQQRRRAREVGADGSYSSREWIDLQIFYGCRCAYCDSGGPLHADHAIPLSRGGDNYIENIRPACPPCNQRKHKLTEDEYRARREAEGLYVRPRLLRVPTLEESSGSFSASLMSREA
jgi:5-methylcytosine-specific restriction endonuclease McrA